MIGFWEQALKKFLLQDNKLPGYIGQLELLEVPGSIVGLARCLLRVSVLWKIRIFTVLPLLSIL